MIDQKFNRHHRPSRQGDIFIPSILFVTFILVSLTSFVGWAILQLKLNVGKINQELAIQVAEAGTDYYRWHLAHVPTDYQDGTNQPGPYIHDFTDKDGQVIGRFDLSITPPPIGSTLVTIVSTGYALAQPNNKRKIKVQLAIPSLAAYAVAANDNMRFGAGTEIFGPIHANGGIRFDGLAHNLVTSAKNCYDDPDTITVNPCEKPGVWTAQGNEPSVFLAGKQFPVPALDFTGFTQNLADIKTAAQQAGQYFAPAGGAFGYHIQLKTNSTFDIYKVTSLVASPNSSCTNSNQTSWGTWSVNAQTLMGNKPMPSNGLIFVEDNLWVDGQIANKRLTIASGRFPENSTTSSSITINNDLLYTNYTGSDVIGLIAQNNLNIGLNSEDDLRIDAALIAKNGRVGRYYYNSACGANYIRTKVTNNGMIATNRRYGFAYTDGTGYQTRNLSYDSNLLYSPPPNFPLTSDQYRLISWEEMK